MHSRGGALPPRQRVACSHVSLDTCAVAAAAGAECQPPCLLACLRATPNAGGPALQWLCAAQAPAAASPAPAVPCPLPQQQQPQQQQQCWERSGLAGPWALLAAMLGWAVAGAWRAGRGPLFVQVRAGWFWGGGAGRAREGGSPGGEGRGVVGRPAMCPLLCTWRPASTHWRACSYARAPAPVLHDVDHCACVGAWACRGKALVTHIRPSPPHPHPHPHASHTLPSFTALPQDPRLAPGATAAVPGRAAASPWAQPRPALLPALPWSRYHTPPLPGSAPPPAPCQPSAFGPCRLRSRRPCLPHPTS